MLRQTATRLPATSLIFTVAGTFTLLSAVALAATVPGGQVDGGVIVVTDEVGVVAPPL